MSLRSPLARARGLGAAHGGTHHWLAHRMTSIILVPLFLWFAFSVAGLAGADHATAARWLGSPFNAVPTLLLILAMFHHTQAGIEVIMEDYIHTRWRRMAALIAMKWTVALLAVAAVFAVLKVAFGY